MPETAKAATQLARPSQAEPVAGQDGPRAGRRSAGFRLVLAALPVLALAAVPFRGVDGTVDLLIVLMVGASA